MSSMIQLFYALTVLGTLIGGYDFLSMLSNAESAPQQAAGAAMAKGWALFRISWRGRATRLSA